MEADPGPAGSNHRRPMSKYPIESVYRNGKPPPIATCLRFLAGEIEHLPRSGGKSGITAAEIRELLKRLRYLAHQITALDLAELDEKGDQ